MKKIFLCLVLTLILISIPSMALAGSDSVIIPHIYWGYFDVSNHQFPFIYVSNLTNQEISVKITVFTVNGSILRSYFSSENVQNFSNNVTDASVSFTLNAYSTGRILLCPGPTAVPLTYGYGSISWSNSDVNSTTGVVAYISSAGVVNGEQFMSEIPINNGLPF